MTWDEVLKVIQIPKVNLDEENKPPEYEPPKDCTKVWNQIVDLVEDFIDEHLLKLNMLEPFRTFRHMSPMVEGGRFWSRVQENDTSFDEWGRGVKDKGWSVYFKHNARKDVEYNFPFYHLILQGDIDKTEEQMCNGLEIIANADLDEMQKFNVRQEKMYYLEDSRDGKGKDINIGEEVIFGLTNFFAARDMGFTMGQFAMLNFSVELNNFKHIAEKEVDSRANSDYWFRHSSKLANGIKKLAEDWAKRNNRYKGVMEKSEEHPLGSITEYHGTVDIGTVLQEGIRGSSPKTRSNRHVPKKLRNAETISYTSDNPEEALKFAQRRAKFLQIPEENVGVVGVRGRDLPKPIIHSDIIMEGETYVREGGIPAKYLVRLG